MLSNPLRAPLRPGASPPLRAMLLVGALSLLALLGGPIASASATVESSRITSPADPTRLLHDRTTESPETVVFTITGTTTGEGEVDIRCYYTRMGKTNGSRLIAEKVKPVANSFSVNVEAKSLETGLPCVLRAVPVGDSTPRPPGEVADPFQGPRIVASEFGVQENTTTKVPYSYDLESNELAGYFAFESVGSCGLDYANLVAPVTLAESDGIFDCTGALYQSDRATKTRSELQLDGVNAYGPTTAESVSRAVQEEQKTKAEPVVPVPGVPPLAVTETFEPASVTIHEVDPLVKCLPEAAVVPPTTKSCKEFVSAGVQLERTWQTSGADHVAWMTDTWRSTDGAAHTLNALYDQQDLNVGEKGGAYRLPGATAFSAVSKGQTLIVPSSAGALYYKSDAETADGGDGEHPQGAIVYDRSPSGPPTVYRGSSEGFDNGFEMPYLGTVPAGGTYTLRMAFVQAYALAEVEALAGEALASYHPALTIASPAAGATVSTPSVTVSGTATDTGGLASLTVDGQAVSVGAGGAWSTSVALNPGANTITALATDQAGLATEKTVSVTYTPIPSVAHASQVGSASGSGGEVTFTIACAGSAGTSCAVESTLTTVERTRNSKPTAVAARRRPRTRSKVVLVGSSTLTIPAGQRVTIAVQLNAAGRSLLARFGRLPVHLSAVQLIASNLGGAVSPGHRSAVIAQNLTVRPHHKPRHKRHHGRR